MVTDELTPREKNLVEVMIETFKLNDATDEEIIRVCSEVLKMKGRINNG